jgi:hypothetical protein
MGIGEDLVQHCRKANSSSLQLLFHNWKAAIIIGLIKIIVVFQGLAIGGDVSILDGEFM